MWSTPGFPTLFYSCLIILRGGFLLIHSGGLFVRELNDYCDTKILAVFPLPDFLTYLTGLPVYSGTLWENP